MGTLFAEGDRAQILSRIDQLTPSSRAVWGRFTAPEMVCHVSSALRQGLGEYDAGPPAGPLRHPPLNWLFIHVLPWPKAKAKSPPEFLAVRPKDWDADLTQLRTLVVRFGERGTDADWPPSKVFGHITGRSWGALQHKHLNHHLTQFGV
jgi:hypothetical protein